MLHIQINLVWFFSNLKDLNVCNKYLGFLYFFKFKRELFETKTQQRLLAKSKTNFIDLFWCKNMQKAVVSREYESVLLLHII